MNGKNNLHPQRPRIPPGMVPDWQTGSAFVSQNPERHLSLLRQPKNYTGFCTINIEHEFNIVS